jgi:transposase-like protein
MVTVHVRIATGVSTDGHREILGPDVASGEDGAGRLALLRAWLPAACSSAVHRRHLGSVVHISSLFAPKFAHITRQSIQREGKESSFNLARTGTPIPIT